LDTERRLKQAVQSYWDARTRNQDKQIAGGKIDAGTRSEVTGGSQMGAMEVLVADILRDAGLDKLDIKTRTSLELPGYYRSEKKWDLIVVSQGQLVLAMEFKSQVGPSFGNNFNNRSEEAIGSATDIWVAYREGRFGNSPTPFLGYFFLLEDCDRVRVPVRTRNHISKLTPRSIRPRTATVMNYSADASSGARIHLSLPGDGHERTRDNNYTACRRPEFPTLRIGTARARSHIPWNQTIEGETGRPGKSRRVVPDPPNKQPRVPQAPLHAENRHSL